MIWFGKQLPGLPPIPPPHGHAWAYERNRLKYALEWVATRAPHLSGDALLDAISETGWIERATAARLLPEFRHFDADRHFAEHLRRLSFRGASVAEEFQLGMLRIVEDLAGAAHIASIGPEPAIRFRHGEREGIVLAYPEVAFSIGGNVRAAVSAAVEEMPDTLVVVARNFQPRTAEQLAGMLARTGVPGTLLTVNLLLGVRAIALRYQPGTDRVIELLSVGRLLRSADIARLGERLPATATV
ncbi:hypothetical protein BH23GEM3_BH23GEM3_19840 [soil metagenome]